MECNSTVRRVNKQRAGYIGTKIKCNNTACFLCAMNDWNLRDSFSNGKQDGGRIQYVKLFFSIACIILLIACINFMNLATARSEQRAKEERVRKVMGAGKGKLIRQLIVQALLLPFISALIAIRCSYETLPL